MTLDFESEAGDRLPYYSAIEQDIRVPEHVRRLLASSSKSTFPRGIFLVGPDTIKLRNHSRLRLRSRPKSEAFSQHFKYPHGNPGSSSASSSISSSKGFRSSLLNLSDISELDNQSNGDSGVYAWESKRIHIRDIPFAQPEVIERPAMITFRQSSSMVDDELRSSSRSSCEYESAMKRFNRTSLALDEASSDLHKRAQNLLHSSSFAIKRPQLLYRDAGLSQSVMNLRDFERNVNDITDRAITQMTDTTTTVTAFNKFTIPRISWTEFVRLGEENEQGAGKNGETDESTT